MRAADREIETSLPSIVRIFCLEEHTVSFDIEPLLLFLARTQRKFAKARVLASPRLSTCLLHITSPAPLNGALIKVAISESYYSFV
jgi:hypothetical protein